MPAGRSIGAPARGILALALLVYSGFALGSGLDRLSATRPELAAMVPAPFAAEALRSLGGQALAAGKAVPAAEYGVQALRDSPTDPQSPALYGAALLARGEKAKAEQAFRIAGQLGWRVPVTQTYWMGRALAGGDYRIAALRLDALLRQQPGLMAQRQLLDPMERNPAGRAAMVERMKLRPAWLDRYAGEVWAAPADIMQQRAEVLFDAARAGLVLGCPVIAPTIERMALLGQLSQGSALWRAHCPVAGSGLVADPRFEMIELGSKPGAFGWQMIGNDELTVGVVPAVGGPGRRITVDGNAARTRLFLSQLTVLQPGRYMLSWRAGNAQESPSDKVLASLVCAGQPPVWLAARLDGRTRRWQAEAIVPSGCPGQQIGFGIAPAAGTVWLEQVELVPVQ